MAHCSRNVETEASNVIADNDVGGSGHFRLAARLFERCGWRDTHSSKICSARENRLDRHKKKPRTVHAAGVLQVVASACRLL